MLTVNLAPNAKHPNRLRTKPQTLNPKPQLGFRVWGLGFGFLGFGVLGFCGFGVWGLGFGVLGLWGFGVWGLGFGV